MMFLAYSQSVLMLNKYLFSKPSSVFSKIFPSSVYGSPLQLCFLPLLQGPQSCRPWVSIHLGVQKQLSLHIVVYQPRLGTGKHSFSNER